MSCLLGTYSTVLPSLTSVTRSNNNLLDSEKHFFELKQLVSETSTEWPPVNCEVVKNMLLNGSGGLSEELIVGLALYKM